MHKRGLNKLDMILLRVGVIFCNRDISRTNGSLEPTAHQNHPES